MGAIRIQLPSDIAEDLLAEKLAIRPLRTRGGGVGAVLGLVIDGVDAGANVVTLVAAAAAAPKIARRILARRRGQGEPITIDLSGPAGVESLVFPANALEEEVAAAVSAYFARSTGDTSAAQ